MATPAVLLNPKPVQRRRRAAPKVVEAAPVPRRRPARRRNPAMSSKGKRAAQIAGGAVGGAAMSVIPDLPWIDEEWLVLAAGALLAFTGRGLVAELGTGAAAYAAGTLTRQMMETDGLFGWARDAKTDGLFRAGGATGALRTVPTAAIPAGSGSLIAALRREATRGLYDSDDY